jgi:hypothetical protein
MAPTPEEPAALVEINAAQPLVIEMKRRVVYPFPVGVDPPPDVRLIRFFADPKVQLKLVDSDGQDYFPSFKRSFENLLEQFPTVVAPFIPLIPRRCPERTVAVHSWWDWVWRFWFTAGPLWYLDLRHGGPFDFSAFSGLEVDAPIVLIVRAKRIPR